MEDVEVSGEPAVPAKDFNLAEYTRRIFGMFAGSETVRAKLSFDNSLTSVVNFSGITDEELLSTSSMKIIFTYQRI